MRAPDLGRKAQQRSMAGLWRRGVSAQQMGEVRSRPTAVARLLNRNGGPCPIADLGDALETGLVGWKAAHSGGGAGGRRPSSDER
jgi:hypothetical protein